MELNEMEKKLLFQVEGDYQTKILNELYMTVRYSNNSEQREAAEGLMAKLRVLSNAECMDLVKDIQKNYRLPYPARTIGEKIAEARQQSGAEKLKGHDIMALERFDPDVRHMIVFDVLSYDSPVGDKGDRMRLFLTDAGYQKFLESQERGEVKLKNHAKVSDGHLHYRESLMSKDKESLIEKAAEITAMQEAYSYLTTKFEFGDEMLDDVLALENPLKYFADRWLLPVSDVFDVDMDIRENIAGIRDSQEYLCQRGPAVSVLARLQNAAQEVRECPAAEKAVRDFGAR